MCFLNEFIPGDNGRGDKHFEPAWGNFALKKREIAVVAAERSTRSTVQLMFTLGTMEDVLLNGMVMAMSQ